VSLIKYIDKKYYPDYGNQWDDVLFREYLLSKIDQSFECLDYGAGRGKVKQVNIRGMVKKIVGVDIDSEVLNNPHVDEAKLIRLTDLKIPYDDNSFDLVFSDNVFEHVECPEAVLQEIYRVLKSGGVFIVKTPNKYHYMPMIARITPLSFHKYYNNLRGRQTVDTFPTFYRCNCKSDLSKYASKIGFSQEGIEYWEGRPEYLRIFTITYIIGLIYERVVNSINLLAPFRSVFVFELKK